MAFTDKMLPSINIMFHDIVSVIQRYLDVACLLGLHELIKVNTERPFVKVYFTHLCSYILCHLKLSAVNVLVIV